MHYVPLNIKTCNCLLSSMIKIDELILKAKELNINALTITDNNMYGSMDFYKACLQNNIKPIIGLTIKIKSLSIVLYAKTNNGYKNLIKLQTMNSNEELTLNDLMSLNDALICIVPFASINLYDELKKIYPDIFIGYQDNNERKAIKEGKLVYFNDILYLNKEDEKYLKYLIAIRDGVLANSIIIDTKENYLLSYEEMVSKYKDDLDNNKYIYDNCNLKLEFNNNLLPVYDCPNNLDSFSYLKKLCTEGLKKRFGNQVYEAYITRLKYELDVINKMGFCNYFLVVCDYVRFAKEHDILVGPGRGSAAGSLVSYLLEITDIDPIKHNLLFERFLNPERITMPDIDIDFEDTKRNDVIKYCASKYGTKKVAPIITFGTMAAKQALRDVARCMNIDLKIVDSICKNINPALTLQENYKQNNKVRELVSISNTNKWLYNVATHFEGLKRHTSIHAAGVVMSNMDLDEIIPLEKSHDDFYITGYDMTYLEEIGLLKMDFLAIKNLTLIKDCLNDIEENILFNNIPINDNKALEIFHSANTIGIFQFESEGMINFLSKLKPTCFDDIVVALALYRPGPMHNIDLFINRKNGKEEINYFHNDLISILKPTYGVIIYQEQIMQIASVLAGFSYGEADILRRAMSKKKEEILLNERDKFIKQSIERGYDKTLCEKVYDLILNFASYGFNKAHSVSYAYIAVKMAYLKAHYPLAFLKQLLNSSIGSVPKTNDYIYECKKNGVNLINTNVNISTEKYIIHNNLLVAPFNIIKGLGMQVSKTIMDERNKRPFSDIFDFVSRTYGKAMNKKHLESLIDAGALDDFHFNRHTLKENIDVITNYSEIGDLVDDDNLKPELTIYEEYNIQALLANEKEVYGFYLSNHPVYTLKKNYENIIDLNKIEAYFDKTINVLVCIDKIKTIKTKNNEPMAFVDVSDELSKIEIMLFPKTYKNIQNLEQNNIYLVKARVEKRFDKYYLNAFQMEKINNKE